MPYVWGTQESSPDPIKYYSAGRDWTDADRGLNGFPRRGSKVRVHFPDSGFSGLSPPLRRRPHRVLHSVPVRLILGYMKLSQS